MFRIVVSWTGCFMMECLSSIFRFSGSLCDVFSSPFVFNLSCIYCAQNLVGSSFFKNLFMAAFVCPPSFLSSFLFLSLPLPFFFLFFPSNFETEIFFVALAVLEFLDLEFRDLPAYVFEIKGMATVPSPQALLSKAQLKNFHICYKVELHYLLSFS